MNKQPLQSFVAVAGLALQHQLTDFLRQLIRQGRLAENERLPTLHELSSLWGTNYFTVQSALAPLVKEGLIVRRPRLGTFVRNPAPSLVAVGLYHNHCLRDNLQDDFAARVNTMLYRRFSESGTTCVAWFDRRRQTDTPLPELKDAVGSRLVQGIIATSAGVKERDWLAKLPVPVAGNVAVDLEHLAQSAVDRLVSAGCRRLAVLSHILRPVSNRPTYESHLYSAFVRQAHKRGATVAPAWVVASEPRHFPDNLEEYGYEQFHALWKHRRKPDGLLVFPDAVAKGVLTAVMECRVKVPDELRLVLHRNEEMAVFSPVPVDWLTVSIRQYTDALVQQLRRQLEGKTPPPVMIRARLDAAAPARAR